MENARFFFHFYFFLQKDYGIRHQSKSEIVFAILFTHKSDSGRWKIDGCWGEISNSVKICLCITQKIKPIFHVFVNSSIIDVWHKCMTNFCDVFFKRRKRVWYWRLIFFFFAGGVEMQFGLCLGLNNIVMVLASAMKSFFFHYISFKCRRNRYVEVFDEFLLDLCFCFGTKKMRLFM